MSTKNSLGYSILLHIALFLVIFFGLPTFFEKHITDEPVITVEILPISELTNVKPAHKEKPADKPKADTTPKNQPKPALPEPVKESKPVETPKEAEPKAEIKKAEVKPEQKPKEVKKEEKKDKKKKEDDSFASVLKSVEKMKPAEKTETKPDDKEDFSSVEDMLSNAKEEKYNPSIPLSVTEKDAIKQQIMQNWTVLAGAKDAASMVVTLHISLGKDGSVTDIKITNQAHYNSDPVFKATADSAVRAVYKSSPLKNLPVEKYDSRDGWSEMDINFDPSEMMN
jgi:outer membrane biosynthesis protein TonB